MHGSFSTQTKPAWHHLIALCFTSLPTTCEVTDAIKALKNDKAAGPDGAVGQDFNAIIGKGPIDAALPNTVVKIWETQCLSEFGMLRINRTL